MKKYTFFAILISLGVLLISSLPIIYFSLYPKDDLVFLGRRYVNSQDVYTYVSFIEQAKQGKNLFENLYTGEPQKPALLRPSFLLTGKFANFTNLSSINAYHISRVVFSLLFFLALYQFLNYFFQNERHKLIAYTIVITSSGLGFLLYKLAPNTVDLWIPEANTFLSLGEAPHFILSQALMLFGYTSFLTYLKDKNIPDIVLSLLMFLILSFEHPFNLMVIAPTLLITALWNKVSWKSSILIAAGSALGLIYQYYTTLTNPILASWQAQNILLSPPPMAYILGYGLIIVLAVIYAEKLLKTNLDTPHKLLIVWILVTALLLYAPVNFQRRLVEGLHIPLGILATGGLLFWVQKYKENISNQIIVFAILLLSTTSIFMVYTDFRMINEDKIDSYYYHINPAEVEAVTWLSTQTTSKDIVLSNWYLGNIIPGLTGGKVYLGHKIQTVDWDGKNKALDSFVQNTDPTTSQKFLVDNSITYIFLGKNDILLKNGFKPENYPSLKSVYEKEGVTIYRVEVVK